jgi:arylsulfatase A-like enzyme
MWHVISGSYYPWALVREPLYLMNMSRDAFTLAKGLKAAGYTTASLGKWHVTVNDDGNYTQLKASAAHYYGFDHVAKPRTTAAMDYDAAVDHLTDEAIRFIDANQGKPWFCYLAHYAVHQKVIAPPELVKKYLARGAPATGLGNATILAALEHLDTSVGRLLTALDERKLTDRTIVVFVSDNGGVRREYNREPFRNGPGTASQLTVREWIFDNAPLRNGKGTLYEGGIRVPCIVRWPGGAKPGTVCDVPIQVTDWLPTLFEMAGASVPAGYPLDGQSIVPLLRGSTIPARTLYWYAPLYDIGWGATPAAAIRRGDFKLIEYFGDWFDESGKYVPSASLQLYNLATDVGETKDLAAQMPDKVKSLHGELRAWLKTMSAEIPGKNLYNDKERPLKESRERPARP